MSENPNAHPATSSIDLAVLNAFASAERKLSPEDQAALATLPAGWAMLIGTNAELRGARFILEVKQLDDGSVEPLIAGRKPKSDIFLDDVTVSREHAVFLPNAGTFILTDNNSLNGTYVNSDRIDSVPLKNGSVVQLGKFTFVFALGTGQ